MKEQTEWHDREILEERKKEDQKMIIECAKISKSKKVRLKWFVNQNGDSDTICKNSALNSYQK